MITRETLEQRECQVLASYAMKSRQPRPALSRRQASVPPRLQRDRDRIIHTTAFRRLEYKTQVFVYSEGDHYRNRLTHSIEVAQIGRTLARGLGCNEDLIEAICLAHDLGHPPFGHVGEDTLNDLMAEYGGFDHQRQTYRILTELEHRYPEHPGLNLTYEVLEGVVKHDTDYDAADARDFHPEERGTLECQLANLADEIAYNTSDLDDGLRSGILDAAHSRQLAIGRKVLASMDAAEPRRSGRRSAAPPVCSQACGPRSHRCGAGDGANLAAAASTASPICVRYHITWPVTLEMSADNRELKHSSSIISIGITVSCAWQSRPNVR